MVERGEKVFLRIEYQDYTPIARALEQRGLEKYFTTRLFGQQQGQVYRYVSSERIVPEGRYELSLGSDFRIWIRAIDDINEPALAFDGGSYDIIVNYAVFRVIPKLEGDVYVAEVPIDALYVPRVRKFFQEIIKLYKRYLELLIEIKKVKLNVEFW